MEIIEALKTNLGYLLLTIIGGMGVISLLLAAGMYMMAQGDQQQQAKARNALFGGIAGLILGGFAYAIPTILSETVLQPSGGQGFGVQEAGSCDDILRRELVLQPNANTTSRMNQVIRVIQAREDDCLSDNWDPQAMSDTVIAAANVWATVGAANGGPSPRGACFPQNNAADTYTVDGIEVPSRLMTTENDGTNDQQVPDADSVRGVNDNILIYFRGDQRPTDLSRCWLYLSRDQLWVSAGQ